MDAHDEDNVFSLYEGEEDPDDEFVHPAEAGRRRWLPGQLPRPRRSRSLIVAFLVLAVGAFGFSLLSPGKDRTHGATIAAGAKHPATARPQGQIGPIRRAIRDLWRHRARPGRRHPPRHHIHTHIHTQTHAHTHAHPKPSPSPQPPAEPEPYVEPETYAEPEPEPYVEPETYVEPAPEVSSAPSAEAAGGEFGFEE